MSNVPPPDAAEAATALAPPPWQGGRRFVNLDGRRLPPPGGLVRLLRWRLGRRAEPELPDAIDAPAQPAEVDLAALAQPSPFEVTWLGHASCLILMDGWTVITDPVFVSVAFGAVRRLAPAPVALADLPRIDAVCVSHNHYDHCDRPSLRALRQRFPEALFVGPAGMQSWLTRNVGGPVVCLPWFESHVLGSPRGDAAGGEGAVQIRAVPAQHWSTRGPHDLCRTHWCGFVVRGPSGSVYFAGDTGFGPHFEAIAADQPNLDLALLPIGAYAPRWFMRDQHMGPQEATEAARILGAQLLPIHWGTYRLTDEPLDEPPRLAARAVGPAGVLMTTLRPGGTWRAKGEPSGRWHAPQDESPPA